MGISSSPRIFTKILKPVFATLRSKYGHSCLGYIDDSFYTETTAVRCEEATFRAATLFSQLGFMVHSTKSVFEPTQRLEFLGFRLDSVSMTVSVTKDKADRIVVLCNKVLAGSSFPIRDTVSFVGTLVATFPGVEYGPLFYRCLSRDKDAALRNSAGNFDSSMSLSAESRIEIEWWRRSLPLAVRKIDHGPAQRIVYTDASLIGWGAKSNDSDTQGLWSKEEALYHINVVEMLAVKFALKSLFSQVHDVHIRIMSDSTTVVSYINSMGGFRSPSCDSVAKSVWLWAIDRHICLSAAHMPGVENAEADRLSRIFKTELEWLLNPRIFQKVVHFFRAARH
ncbi:uncharacterized protein LOC117122547 [Anneissia japonica]|uniref:uncharacterized protein LOC117122547 n=1 Tax=Anneissia japonica TaxID=1529436 RepID=UPI001425A6C9|nr:uncharacterized protein LOC117122547 [Anneissia japonica]